MEVLIIQIAFILLLCLISAKKYSGINISFLDKDYTNLLRAVAILFVIVHHVGNVYGSRITTPLGGIGVSLFLMISGYGLNESYKTRGGA